VHARHESCSFHWNIARLFILTFQLRLLAGKRAPEWHWHFRTRAVNICSRIYARNYRLPRFFHSCHAIFNFPDKWFPNYAESKNDSCESLSLAISSRLTRPLVHDIGVINRRRDVTNVFPGILIRTLWYSASWPGQRGNDWRSKSFIKTRHEELDEIATGMTNRRWRT